ncbi:hypothetical protein ACKC9G_14410 [Pokkaliibacter sp. CJK22405]|uniref:hypothetical protein n=1 Tax=Pokkaliibacter sp. CJK22405 TaxID=3384615 RepID=UPI003984DEEA
MKWISFLSNVMTVLASGIAIYIFVSNKDKIASVFTLLMNYSQQLSLSELKEKIERLNEYNAKDSEECERIVNIFNEILGQLKGNEKIKSHFIEMIESIENMVSDRRRLTEPKKRALVSELRERLRHLSVKSIDDLVEVSK